MPQTTSGPALPDPSARGRIGFSRLAETGANLATVAVAILLSIVLVRTFILPRTSSPGRQPPMQQSSKGTNLKGVLPGVDWAKNGRTLVLALSTQCHFCTDSLPFFQQVSKDSGCHVKLLAVLPQNKSDSGQFLSNGGVRVDEVRQASMDSIGVRGTPTLLLVDEKGTVTDEWQGKLSHEQEEQVLSELRKPT